jgi:hypothetical protein
MRGNDEWRTNVRPKFLLDENLDPAIAHGVRRRDPSVEILRVGDAGAPSVGTPDPEILKYCEQEQRILVTNNRASMPEHIAVHMSSGRHYWGILTTRSNQPPLNDMIEALLLVAGASEAEEYVDIMYWIP